MTEKEMTIRGASAKDLDGICQLYSSYMFDSHLLRLGEPFVKRYLTTILKSGDCITLIAEEGGIYGFIMSTLNAKNLFLGLLHPKTLFYWLGKLLVRPGAALRCMGLAFYPLKTRIEGVNAELLFIAVDPRFRHRGLAAALIKRTLDLMKDRGVKKVKVSTQSANEGVNALLKKLGFKTNKTFSLFKKQMYLYEYSLQ